MIQTPLVICKQDSDCMHDAVLRASGFNIYFFLSLGWRKSKSKKIKYNMQCENIVDGKLCKTKLLSTEKFCPECGCNVKQDSVKRQLCGKCQALVVEGQKFCSNCSWKIDQDIFKGK